MEACGVEIPRPHTPPRVARRCQATKAIWPGYLAFSERSTFLVSDSFITAVKMPMENLEEEGLPKNPNLELAAWRFTINNPEGKDKEDAKKRLLETIKENGMCGTREKLCFVISTNMLKLFVIEISIDGV